MTSDLDEQPVEDFGKGRRRAGPWEFHCLGGSALDPQNPPRRHCVLQLYHPGDHHFEWHPVVLATLQVDPGGVLGARCSLCRTMFENPVLGYAIAVRDHYGDAHPHVDLDAVGP